MNKQPNSGQKTTLTLSLWAMLHSFHSSTIDASQIRQIVTSTLGIIFLGTPQQGPTKEQWAYIVGSVPGASLNENDGLLRSLEVGNPSLETLQDEFVSLLRARSERNHPLYITCFNEGLSVHLLGTVRSTSIRRRNYANAFIQMSNRKSTPIVGYRSYNLPCDHQQLSRFSSSSDAGYQRIVSEMAQWLDSHDASIAGRKTGSTGPKLAVDRHSSTGNLR